MKLAALATLIVVAAALPSASVAQEVVLKNGTVLRGQLVGMEAGFYIVRIGRFEKRVPEADVADVRDPSVAPAAGGSPPSPSTTATQGLSKVRGGPHSSSHAPAVSRSGAGSAPRAAPAGPIHNSKSVQDLLGKLGVGAGAADPDSARAGQSLGNLLDQPGSMDPGQLESMRDNPAMQKLVERFADPGYQQSLMDGLQEVGGEDGGPNGQQKQMLDTLRQLFDQLNAAKGSPSPAAGAGRGTHDP